MLDISHELTQGDISKNLMTVHIEQNAASLIHTLLGSGTTSGSKNNTNDYGNYDYGNGDYDNGNYN